MAWHVELALGVAALFLAFVAFYFWSEAGVRRKEVISERAFSKLSDELWAERERLALGALDKERDAHTVTRERLYASWKDGHTIPAPPEPPSEPDLALPDELAPIWEVWEGTGQEKMKTLLRQRIAQGRDVHSLLEEYGFLPPKE